MRRILAASALAAVSALGSSAVVIDFELLSVGSNPGNVYAAQGVTFSYGQVTSGLNLGDTVVLPAMTGAIFGSKGSLAWSPDTVGYAPGTNDLLMTFSSPVTFVSLITDRYVPESNDLVQLVALDDNFNVVALMNAQDGGTTLVANSMSVSSPVPFRYALFVSTTEQEGIDDLTFVPVPEPFTMALGAAGLAVALRRRRR
ncbi:MAG: hypothetical protein N2109_02690 [Fimbriimonadales bacterium]|nr:hypothetical protein [Fimbriimonadales bacterium]